MRNLSLSAVVETPISNANVSATTIDLDENVIYAASERQNLDGEVEVEIWKIADGQSDSTGATTSVVFTVFTATVSSDVLPHQVVSLRIQPETRVLIAIMGNGDLTSISFDEDGSMPVVEGTVEPGILAASWNPDDSLVAMISGEFKLIVMTSTFDVLSEAPLDTTDFGEDAQVNVGWGSKQTQFHGSLGKAAAQAPAVSVIGSSPDDDTMPRLSWRGDGALFVVSSLSPPTASGVRRRILRVYDRQAALQSTSEAVAGLEHSLAWRPSGNLIAATQRFGFEGGGSGREGRHDVVFFERNGLRHGEFGIRVGDLGSKAKTADEREARRWGYKVREMSWSSDSNVLGIWIEHDEGDIVQLWAIGNYHWYLKQEIIAPSSSSASPGRFTSVTWHPERALHIILTTSCEIIQRTYSWETFVSPSQPPIDSGLVAVFDGLNTLLTSFRIQNVPPPMSSHQLALTSASSPTPFKQGRIPIHAAFSSEGDRLAVLWETGYVEIWSLQTRLEPGRGKAMDPSKIWSGVLSDTMQLSRQIAMSGSSSQDESTVIVLGSNQTADVITTISVKGSDKTRTNFINLPHRNCRLVASDKLVVFQAPSGELYQYDIDKNLIVAIIARFPEFCLQSQGISVSSAASNSDEATDELYVGLTKSGKLYITGNVGVAQVLSTNVTSFTIASSFVIFTTSAHEVTFAPVKELLPLLTVGDSDSPNVSKPSWETRKVERGSRIVVAVPSSMSLVLQMPRGNLETINPRPLVMEVVKQDLDAGNYRKAFFACRKHRIDLNVLVDHDQEKFMQGISFFVDQVHEVDHINLFLTGLGRGFQSKEVIIKVCDAIRLELERKDLTKYVNSILTAYVVKTPPDHEAGLALLLRLRGSNPNLVEDAVKYIIFLVDADRLFDTALGMYDFSLVLMIAQHAQKDPREYLPFLRELRVLDKYYQRFRIDDHLKRYQSALKNLSLAGSEKFDEAVAYIEQHQLYDTALSIWKNTDRYEFVLNVHGDWLFERREFRQAALVFVEAKKLSKAMVAHEKALEWQELFDLAYQIKLPEEDIVQMGYRVAEDLTSKKRFSDAARVLLDYSKDMREAVIALVQGNKFSEARRITTLNSKPELLVDVIYPAALESRAQMSEDVTEMRDQLRKQLDRLRELRTKKIEDPDAFYGAEDLSLHNVDVMTDASMAPTAFTRYTVAPTTASRSSKRSSRSKRKLERKVGSGRKGTVDEEEYLLKSITKLVGRFNAAQDEIQLLLPHLSQFTPEHRTEGLELQKDVRKFEVELKVALEEIWTRPSRESQDQTAPVDTWASRMEEKERGRGINPIDKIPKPMLTNEKGGRVNILEFE